MSGLETDIVVIGSGVTGLAAALTAAEGNAKVLIYEKQRSPGGTSNFFSGMFAVESSMQRKKYITYSRDQAFKNIMEYSHWRANARLVRAVVNESSETIDWLQHNGVEFTDANINMPDAPRTYHFVKGKGEAVIKTLISRLKEKGVGIKLGSPVKKILKQRDSISGVVAEENDNEISVPARVVVIASGGYANNREWIKKYSGFDLNKNIIPVGNVDKMGDGIRMAWEAGADEEGLGVLELFAAGPVEPEFTLGTAIELAAAQPDLWVDPAGIRFCDESIAFYDTSMGNANARYKEGFTYRLFDESIKNSIIDKGIFKQVRPENPPGTRPLNLDKEIQTAIERGSTEVFSANSIEELAKKTGMNPLSLKASIDEYNRFCEKGHDDLFAKDPRYLRPLLGPKYYAVKARTIFLGTLGGIRINHNTAVLDRRGYAIPGLYAGGFDAGGMWGDSYCIKVSSGLAAGFAVNSGRIAGKNALKYLSM